MSLLSLRGAEDLTAAVAWGVLQAVVTALLMNVAIVGFNQVCDVEIDKVRAILHKPQSKARLSRQRARR